MNLLNKFSNLDSSNIENLEDEKNKIIIFTIIIACFIVHVVYLCTYIVLKIDLFISLNILSLCTYAICLLLLKYKFFYICFDIMSIEIILYAVITSTLTGYKSNTLWFIGIVITSHYLFLNSSTSRKVFYTVLSIFSINFIINWIGNFAPIYEEASPLFISFLNANIFIIFIVFEYILVNSINKIYKEIYTNNILSAKKESLIDPLTKLWNRRYLDNIKDNLLRQAKEGISISIVMIDIDNFKKINDVYGHTTGDEVLVALSKEMISNFRTCDSLIRFGGEEFLIVMLNANELQAFKIMDRFRLIMNNTIIKKGTDFTLSITFTGGISSLSKYKDLDKAIQEADKRLYKGKNSGKNKIIYTDI